MDRPVILSDGRSHGPYQASQSNNCQASNDGAAPAPILMPGPRRQPASRPLHSAFNLRPTYEVPALQFDTGRNVQTQRPGQDETQHWHQQALPPVPADEQRQPRQPSQQQQHRQGASAAVQDMHPYNCTGDSAWSYGGAHSTALDTLLLPHPRDAEVDALEAELIEMRNAVSSPTAASLRLSSPPSARPPTAPLARQQSLPISLQPATIPGTLMRSTTLKPGSTLAKTGSLTLTVRRQRNQATAERARVRLQCLHQDEAMFRRLAGWQALLFRVRRLANETLGFLQLWRKSIQKVEGKHGSNVATTLCLIRFAFVMNLLLLLLWLLVVVLPFWVKPPVTFRWNQLTAYSAKSVVQGFGLDNTFLLYGGYNYIYSRRGHGNPSLGIPVRHQPIPADLGFPIAIVVMLIGSLLLLLRAIGSRLKGNGDRPAVVFDVFRYRFATLVFASWDYHLTDHAAAANLRRSIRQQLREMLNDAADDDVHVTVLARFTAQIRKAIGLGVVWPATVAAVAACSYYTLKYEVAINHFIATDFATSIILSLITTVGASLVRASMAVELWHPRYVTGVLAAKLFTIKLCYLSALTWHLYVLLIDGRADISVDDAQQTCRYVDHTDVKCRTGTVCCNAVCAHYQTPPNDPLKGRCVPACPETTIGLLLYRLMITNALIINGCDLGRGLILRHCTEQAFDPPDVVLTVIENQALVWLGAAMAPFLPLLGAASNALHFAVQKLLALHCFAPPKKPYSASRTSTIAHGLMLVALAGCTITNGFNLQYHRQTCGPHQGTSMKNAFGDLVQAAPRGLSTTVTWFASPIVLGGLAILLLFCIVVLQSRVAKFRRDVHRLKEDFTAYRRDMKEKVVMTRKLGAAGALLPLPAGNGTTSRGGGANGDIDSTSRNRLELVAASHLGATTAATPTSRLAQFGKQLGDTHDVGTLRGG